MATKNEAIANAVNEAIVGEMTGKKWYFSKTFWSNVVMAGAVFAQSQYGFVVSPELQLYIIAGVNLVLRKISKQEIVW
jgi:hypothetical protein